MQNATKPTKTPAHAGSQVAKQLPKLLSRKTRNASKPKHERNDAPKPTLAVFIDAENVSRFKLNQIFDAALQNGRIKERRAYGIWQGCPWGNSELAHYAIQARYISRSTQGKNAADIAMTADAVDLFHTDPSIDGFVIASSDSDFSALAIFLRNGGKRVIGIGLPSAPSPYKESCDRFIEILPAEKATRKKTKQPKAQKATQKQNELKIVAEPESIEGKIRMFIEAKGGKSNTSEIACYVRDELSVKSLKDALGYKKISTYLRGLDGVSVKKDRVRLVK